MLYGIQIKFCISGLNGYEVVTCRTLFRTEAKAREFVPGWIDSVVEKTKNTAFSYEKPIHPHQVQILDFKEPPV